MIKWFVNSIWEKTSHFRTFMKKNIMLTILLFSCLQLLNSIVLQEKVDALQEVQRVKGLINQKKFSEARKVAVSIKKSLPETEFVPLVNYYLGLMEYQERNYYTSWYHVQNSLEDLHFNRLVQSVQLQVKYLAAQVTYRMGLTDESIVFFTSCLKQDLIQVDAVNLYLSDIYGSRKKDLEKSRWYFSRIDWKKLNFVEKELYSLLADTILWDQIDTANIGYGDPNISDMVIDKDLIYIGLWNGGLIVHNHVMGKSELVMPPQVVSENIRALYNDSRYIYIGTTNGVTLYDKRTGSWYPLDDIGDLAVSSICGDGSTVLIGTTGSDQFIYDKETRTTRPFSKKSLYHIVKIYYSGNRFYIATRSQGIFTWDGTTLVKLPGFGRPGVPVTDMLLVRGQLWLSTFGEGVFRYSMKEQQYYRYSRIAGDIGEDFCLSLTHYDNRIYCGTLGRGIYTFNERTGAWDRYSIPDTWLATDIQVMEFNDSHLYIGTLGNGVLKKFIIKR
jgi:hypothetical protein